jgi:ParB family chromosome partitioning protein
MEPGFETVRVPLTAIDRSDIRFSVSTDENGDALTASIAGIGLLSPVILRRCSIDRHVVVSGFRRLSAWAAMTAKAIPARVLPPETTDSACIRLAIGDNALARPLNLIETARCLNLLQRISDDIHQVLDDANTLGVAVNAVTAAKVAPLVHLPRRIQQQIIDGSVGLQVGQQLGRLARPDALALSSLISDLKLGGNVQRELIIMTSEIAARDDVSIAAVLGRKAVADILRDETGDRGLQRRLVRDLLRRWRFPSLATIERRFAERLKALHLGNRTRIDPPRHFEGRTYSLNCRFASAGQLETIVNRLQRHLESGRLRELLHTGDAIDAE